MIYLVLALWVTMGILMLLEKRNIRLIIYMCIFSTIASATFLIMGSSDAAMAEAAIGAFTTIFFIICFEKYGDLKIDHISSETVVPKKTTNKCNYIMPILLVLSMAGLALFFLPSGVYNVELKNLYLAEFLYQTRGENAVTIIYLGYRVYDTLFEALILVIAVVAIAHMSYFRETSVQSGNKSHVGKYIVVVYVLRFICAVIMMYGIYLTINGHISAGGSFVGGLFIAAFFICRYLIYDIYDLKIRKIQRMEDMIFISIVLLAILVIFMGAYQYHPVINQMYLIGMNIMIALKVTCGFLILFYRYVAIERR